jgi:hypothetical protein
MTGNTWKSLTAALDLLEAIGVTTTFRYHAIGEGDGEGEGEGETLFISYVTAALHCTAALTG